jgi:DUF4097 and DUF4098 domain-containing protein YvlB
MREVFETPGPVTVVVENEVGVVDIECVETTITEVTLEADTPAAQDLIEVARVTCTPGDAGRMVSVLIPRRRFVLSDGVSVRVRAPFGTTLRLATASAEIRVRGRSGRAVLKTASGSIVVEEAGGDVRAQTASGTISLGAILGEVRAQSASGDIHVALAGPADLKSVSGDVRLGQLKGDGNTSTVSGRIEVARCGPGRLRAKSVSGAVTLGIAPGVSMRVDADSFSGQVRSEIPIGDEGPAAGDPDLVVAIQTVSGDVTLQRAAEPAAA